MTVYTHTARFDGTARALTNDELFKLAPSIFATTAHDSRSARFKPIPTIDILDGLRNEGFMPVGAQQAVARQSDKQAFTKHLIRLRRLDDGNVHAVGDTVCELLLKNANDGSSAYDLMAALFRIRCQNSLVSQTRELASAKVRHSGDAMGKVIEGSYEVLREAHRTLAAPEAWGQITLDRDEAQIMARAAHVLRFGEEDIDNHPVMPATLLAPRRAGDTAPDLWSRFNVVQENVVRGGLHGHELRNGRFRNVTTRAIKSIDDSVKLNKALWVLATEMAKLKGVDAGI